VGVYTLSYVSDEKAPDGTSYNDLPFNWKPMTEDEFAKSGFVNGNWSRVEFRQMYPKTFDGKRDVGSRMIEARLFWLNDDTGIAIVSDYWKGKVNFYKFGCHHSLKNEKFSVESQNTCIHCKSDISQPWMKLVTEDSGWSMNKHSSRPNRGIRDYDRTIKFNRTLTTEELTSVVSFLKKVDCPGWTGVTNRAHGSSYLFSTTYDSSD
jgi:hypothetical protein